MTSSSSVISLCRRALLQIGARATIASLDEGSTESVACSVLYTPVYEQLARSAYWNCLRQTETLSLLAAAKGTPENPDGTTLPLPPVPWLYQYQAPSNNLDVRYLIPDFINTTNQNQLTTVNNETMSCLPVSGQVDFAVAYATDTNNNPLQVILTNLSQAVCVYTVNQPNPIIFDSLFEQAIVASLAAFLVPALSLNISLMQMSIKSAEAAISMARVRDGDEGFTTQNRQADWIVARSSGSRYGTGWGNSRGMGCSNMSWPG